MWRIMDKVVDSQNHAKGTRVDLPDEKKRVRIEVSLGLEELHDQGLEWLDDLEDFNFVRMQGRYFRFMRPTFADHGDGVEAGAVAGRYIENERRTKFWNTGVLGIQAQDGAIARERKKNRKELRSRLRQVGRRLKAESKMGKGGTGTLVAYEELNAKIEAALRHLGEKVRRG
jgi:hypothetical protein